MVGGAPGVGAVVAHGVAAIVDCMQETLVDDADSAAAAAAAVAVVDTARRHSVAIDAVRGQLTRLQLLLLLLRTMPHPVQHLFGFGACLLQYHGCRLLAGVSARQ